MSDALKKVQSGQPLVIPASAYNAFIDAAIHYRAGQQNQSQTPQAAHRSSGIVLVKNASGADRDRFSVLGIDAPIILPGDHVEEFKRQVAIACVTPEVEAHQGRFVVLQEPLRAGAIGWAWASGVCPVQVTLTDPDHRYAELGQHAPDSLTSGDSGSARILWFDPTGGTSRWCIVRLGVGGTAGLALPPPGLEYQVLQLQHDESDLTLLVPVWDWVRAHT